MRARLVDLTGLAEIAPEDPEPEFVDVNSDNIAVVTLQENNHIALVDLATGAVTAHFPAGSVDLAAIDTEDDGVDRRHRQPRGRAARARCGRLAGYASAS